MTIPLSWGEGWAAMIVNHLWQSTVVVGLAWVLAVILRKNHARVRYLVWLAASMKFLLPFSLLVAAGEWMRSLVPAVAVAQPTIASAMEEVTQPFAEVQYFNAAAPVEAHPLNWLPWMLLAVWVCGAAVVLVRFGHGWRKVYHAKRAARLLDLAADVPVLSTTVRIEPGIVGIFRPVLLLPEGISDRLTAGQMRAIVAHEMAHVRRRDNLTFVLHMIVETLFWFYPLVWWIGSKLLEERERACDEAVVQAGGEAQIYAEGILNVCKFYVESPVACVAGVTGADLKKRIVTIMAGQIGRKLNLGRKVLVAAAGLIATSTPVVIGLIHARQTHAQSPAGQSTTWNQRIVGIWQGTLTLPNALHGTRYVIRITTGVDGTCRGALFNADQGNAPLTFDSVKLQNSDIKLSSPMITVEGKLSPDGNTIDGHWSAGRILVPVAFARTSSEAAWSIPEPIKPMATDAQPEFEVVTIKPGRPNTPGKLFRQTGTHFGTLNTNLDDLMMFAYGVHTKQIIGLPGWADNDLFDIDGVPDVPGQPSGQQAAEMLQKLLADRFQLKIHRETRELPVYAIRVASGGPKMTQSTSAPGEPSGLGFRGVGDLAARNMSMAGFARGLQSAVMDEPVVDETGLTGRYDFSLRWTSDSSPFAQAGGVGAGPPPAGDNPNAPPNLYTAIQEQLGLKLEPRKASVEVLVIEHVERPTAN
jgi:bla regulator protein blaR1